MPFFSSAATWYFRQKPYRHAIVPGLFVVIHTNNCKTVKILSAYSGKSMPTTPTAHISIPDKFRVPFLFVLIAVPFFFSITASHATATITLVHTLGKEVVAEGVETGSPVELSQIPAVRHCAGILLQPSPARGYGGGIHQK